MREFIQDLQAEEWEKPLCSLETFANPEQLPGSYVPYTLYCLKLGSSCWPGCPWVAVLWFHWQLSIPLFPWIFQWLHNSLIPTLNALYWYNRLASPFLNEPCLIYPLFPESFGYKNFEGSFVGILFLLSSRYINLHCRYPLKLYIYMNIEIYNCILCDYIL